MELLPILAGLTLIAAAVAMLVGALRYPVKGKKEDWHGVCLFSIFTVLLCAFCFLISEQRDHYITVPLFVGSLTFTALYALWCFAWQRRYDKRHPEAPASEPASQGA